MRKRWYRILPLLLCLALLAGCRTRTTGGGTDGAESGTAAAGEADSSLTGGTVPGEAPETREGGNPENTGESGGITRENPEASRKEYDEDAPAEILPGTDRYAEGEGEGDGAPRENPEAERSAVQLHEAAQDPAVREVPAEEAEQAGVSEDGAEADSALTYYTVLLQERTGNLFECKRVNVYWETAEDHTTIHKSSPEHTLILGAGAYDVSARLMAENLRVDDGWIGRKNPGAIVKAVDGSVLGAGVQSTASARAAYAGLISREGWAGMDAVRNGRVLLLSSELLQSARMQTFAMLAVAKTAYPEEMADVDLDEALEMLYQEATGSSPGGIYYYGGGSR